MASSVKSLGWLLPEAGGQGAGQGDLWMMMSPGGSCGCRAWNSNPRADLSVSLPLGLALGSPIFPSGCEGKLGVALESLQGLRDLT